MERYRLQIERDGYEVPSSEALGQFAWNPQASGVVDENGASVDALIERPPLNGQITVNVTVAPEWIPEEQKFTRVTLKNEFSGLLRVVEAATRVTPAVFDGLNAGLYTVSAHRAGFQEVVLDGVELNSDRFDVALNLTIHLTRLADSEIDLEGQTIDACELRNSEVPLDLTEGNFSGALLTGPFGGEASCPELECGDECGPLMLEDADFTNADFSQGADLSGAKLSGARFFGADMEGVRFRSAELNGANFFGAQAQGSFFARADLANADFQSANLSHARFAETAEERRYPETHPWEAFRVPRHLVRACTAEGANGAADLAGTNFGLADLTYAFFVGADLRRTRFLGADMRLVDLRHTCLDRVSLVQSNLSDAVLDGASVRAGNLAGAVMNRTSARGSLFVNASMAGAIIESADFRPYPPEGGQRCQPETIRSELGLNPDEPFMMAFVDGGACRDNLDAEQAEQCRCLTSFQGANLNGANLIGTQFEDVSLRDATMIGSELGPAPVEEQRLNDDCRTHALEIEARAACRVQSLCGRVQEAEPDFCGVPSGQTLGSLALTLPHLELANVSTQVKDCFSAYTAFAPDISCPPLEDIVISNAVLCNDDDLPADRFMNQFEWSRSCTPESVRRTLALERAGAQCERRVDDLGAVGDDECCPSALVPADCRDRRVSFARSLLEGATLRANVLDDVNLDSAIFLDADLRNATLASPQLRDSDLTDARMSGARISGGRLIGANTGADLRGGELDERCRDDGHLCRTHQ